MKELNNIQNRLEKLVERYGWVLDYPELTPTCGTKVFSLTMYNKYQICGTLTTISVRRPRYSPRNVVTKQGDFYITSEYMEIFD